MKHSDWNQGLNHIDPDLVEEFVSTSEHLGRKKRRGVLWLRIGVIAACLGILVASVFAIAPLFRPEPPSGIPLPGETEGPTPGMDDPPIQITDGRAQTPAVLPFYYTESSAGNGGASGDLRADGISVTARYVEALPDTYMFFDQSKQIEFRLLRMETIKLLRGGSMVDEFYYIIPVQYMTDFSLYDCFVLTDMGQYGTIFTVLYNVTDGCAESMDLILFGCRSISVLTDYLGGGFMMAFDENGVIDPRLWQSNEAWQKTSDDDIYYYGTAYTLAKAEEDKLKYASNLHVYRPESLTDAAIKELNDLRSFKNGFFLPRSSGTWLFYTELPTSFGGNRYINGFFTNESISVSTTEVSEDGKAVVERSNAQFSEEDMKRLPDLPSAIKNIEKALNQGQIEPPHAQAFESFTLRSKNTFAWYAKTDDGVIGIVRINWKYDPPYQSSPPVYCFDYSYYVIEYGADTIVPMDYDALLDRLGSCESTYVYKGDANKIWPVW